LLFSSFELDYVPLPFAAELLGLPAVGYWAFSFASGPQVYCNSKPVLLRIFFKLQYSFQ
jgi:hypothetical protein